MHKICLDKRHQINSFLFTILLLIHIILYSNPAFLFFQQEERFVLADPHDLKYISTYSHFKSCNFQSSANTNNQFLIPTSTTNPTTMSSGQCYNCNEYGHISRDCPKGRGGGGGGGGRGLQFYRQKWWLTQTQRLFIGAKLSILFWNFNITDR